MLKKFDELIMKVQGSWIENLELGVWSFSLSFDQIPLSGSLCLKLTENRIIIVFQSGTKKTLKPVVSDEIVNEAKAKVQLYCMYINFII